MKSKFDIVKVYPFTERITLMNKDGYIGTFDLKEFDLTVERAAAMKQKGETIELEQVSK